MIVDDSLLYGILWIGIRSIADVIQDGRCNKNNTMVNSIEIILIELDRC